MEGVSHEACSLAGTLGLGKLIAFWDDNGISIDGHVEAGSRHRQTFQRSYGWHVIPVDGHDAMPSKSPARRQGGHRQTDPDLLQDHHRHGLAQQAGFARLPAPARQGRNRRRPRIHRLAARPVRDPGDVYAAWNRQPAGAVSRKTGTSALPPTAPPSRPKPPNSSAAS